MSVDAARMPTPPSGGEGRPLRDEAQRIRAEAVRAYDIRGLVGRDIDEGGAYALGRAFADAAAAAGLARIGVARDGRLSSAALEKALVEGLVEGGMQVQRVGLGPTPMLGFAVRELALDGAIMVTASHNPPAENGFKVLMGGERVHGPPLQALVQRSWGPPRAGSARQVRVLTSYVAALARAAASSAAFSVAWDCGNGATGPVVERLIKQLPGQHLPLNTRVDGRFPAHHPDPAVAANLEQLAEAVTDHGCDLGFAFDGDGDRLGVVDGEGQTIWADQLLLLLARDVLRHRPGAAVVADVKSSRVLFDGVAAAGGRASLAPSGYVLVREAMLGQKAALAGELSGHIFFGEDWGGVDDAIYAAVRTLLALSALPGGLRGFRESLPVSFATPELRLPCPEARKAEVVEAVARRLGVRMADPSMGLRVERPDGWWLLRASGTEPKLTCRCEASRPEGLQRLRDELRAQLALSGVAAEV